jgi:hypothetical protein
MGDDPGDLQNRQVQAVGIQANQIPRRLGTSPRQGLSTSGQGFPRSPTQVVAVTRTEYCISAVIAIDYLFQLVPN